ncbi:hypothetical protein [Robinsoniella peoriensis]|uniref:hypothetical protein n=1 Tax=Robinsoniella peoriensis TaxID=180332 RepID=UPI001364CE63|nr:hypothetical protein [Robinsoniella peoriensis]
MEKQMVKFAVVTENGVVNRIGKAYIVTPEIRFQGGEVSWLVDKLKTPLYGNGHKK